VKNAAQKRKYSVTKFCFFVWFIMVMLSVMVKPTYAEVPALVDLRAFFRNPAYSDYKLSPNGEYVAYLGPWHDRANVWVRKVSGDAPVVVTHARDRDIMTFVWTTDERIVYVHDVAGDENYRLTSVKRNGTGAIELTPWPKVRADVVSVPRADRRHILIRHNRRDAKVFDVYRVDVETGQSSLLIRNPGDVTGYLTDHQGIIRIETVTDGVDSKILYRANSVTEFREVIKTNFRENFEPQLFSFDDQRLIALSNIGRDKNALVEVDPNTGRELRVYYENPDVDLQSVIVSEKNKQVVGVAFETDKLEYRYFNRAREKLQTDLEMLLSGLHVTILGSNDDEKIWLIRSWSDLTQGNYYLFYSQKQKLVSLGAAAPWLDPARMATMTPVVYAARDGLVLHGYLTVPKGLDSKELPMIVKPHGGPWWIRDSWHFDAEAQFLANRGYAVLQVNFRGSSSYGRRFWEASFGQWGRAMQDDLTDGVAEMVRRGIADAKRIGIYGGSYGGYATLAGVAFTPDVYAAAVDYVGVSNLKTFLATIPPYWEQGRSILYQMIGNPDDPAQSAALEAQSPISRALSIRTPLMVAQGLHDPRVKKNESDQIVNALRMNGINAPYMVKENEGHGFVNVENQFDFYRAMEQFFGRYLGGRVASGKDVLAQIELAGPARK
jgi:dipeptidyl aminopeptidase/acylaminoacyl peptidase